MLVAAILDSSFWIITAIASVDMTSTISIDPENVRNAFIIRKWVIVDGPLFDTKSVFSHVNKSCSHEEVIVCLVGSTINREGLFYHSTES
jgi:hypothetical protein